MSNQKAALVTGGSRGIGFAMAKVLAERGYNLCLVGRSQDNLEMAKDKLSKNNITIKLISYDLSNCENIKTAIVDETIKELGRVDVLINSAGISKHESFDKISLSDYDKIMDINVKALTHLCHHSVEHLKKNNEGVIVNISSIAGLMTYKSGTMYCSSKWAVKGFSGALFDDIREHKIKVTTIYPGYVATDMAINDKLDVSKMIQPDDMGLTLNIYFGYAIYNLSNRYIKLRPQRTPYL